MREPIRYSFFLPLAAAEISVELGGCSGLPHDRGPARKGICNFKMAATFISLIHSLCWHIKLRLSLQLVSDHSQPLVPSNRAQLSLPPGRFQNDTET